MSTPTLDKTSTTEATATPYSLWRARLTERFGAARAIRNIDVDIQTVAIGVTSLVMVGAVIEFCVKVLAEFHTIAG